MPAIKGVYYIETYCRKTLNNNLFPEIYLSRGKYTILYTILRKNK